MHAGQNSTTELYHHSFASPYRLKVYFSLKSLMCNTNDLLNFMGKNGIF